MSENDELETPRRTTEDLRQVWSDMFHEVTLSSCKIEKSDHLLKVSMLLKTLFNTHKSLVSELARQDEDRRKQKEITEQKLKEKEEIIHSLMEQLTRLKEAKSSGEDFQRILPSLDVRLFDSAIGDVSIVGKSVTPPLGVKRLSGGESDDMEICFESSTKKGKVDLAPSTPTKDVIPEILVPETLECDYEATYRVPSNLFIPETLEISEDMFQDLNHSVIMNFEKSPSKEQPSPATPKSPIIRTSKLKKSQNEENKSPRYCGPQIPFPLLSDQRQSPVKAKKLSSGSTSPLKSTTQQIESDAFLLPSSANARSKSSKSGDIHGLLSLSKGKSDKVPSPRRENVSSTAKPSAKENHTLVLSSNSKQNKKQVNVASSYVGGKLEVLPPDKTKKSSKLKQTKLSLSMFQAKRVQSETSALDENEQLQRAIKESIKLANAEDDEEEKILFSPSPDRVKPANKSLVNVNQSMDPDKTYFESAETFFNDFPELGVGLLDCRDKVSDETDPSYALQKKMGTVEEEYLCGYDRGLKKNEGPGYAYKAPVVRKKDERKQLQGWECHECKEFLEAMCKNMTEEERKLMMNKCSKHRQALPYLTNTPPGIWEVAALQTPEEETQACGLIPHRLVPGSRLIDKAVVIAESLESNLLI